MRAQLKVFLKQTTILTSLVAVFGQPALANPEDGVVVAGSATISTPDPTTMLIDQGSDRAIIDWASFNIAAGETTQFIVPDADSWTLNRVVGSQSPSLIYGSILSNGNVVIVNPDGMLFGAGATVDVNRLIATTADIGNGDFMAGRLSFGIAGNPGASIVNEGTITAADYGLAALVAPVVRNSGIITARLGTVSLAAGNRFTIDPYGDGLIKLAIGDEVSAEVFDVATGEAVSSLVQNDGTLSANGGTVAMTAATARRAVDAVINTTGVVEARSVGMQNGMIVLGASTATTAPAETPVQTVRVSGTLDATGTDPNDEWPLGTEVTGGRIEVTGEAILATDATIDASGRDGGGTVLIGGDYLGGNIDAQEAVGLGVELEDSPVETASLVVLDDTVTISADATQTGDGGKVIVWSDDVTLTAAEITARGGAESGDGGFIETSGKNYLSVLVAADASARNGLVGTWLMDPVNIRIVDGTEQHTDIQANYYFGPFPVNGALVDLYGTLITPEDQYTLTPDGFGGYIRTDVHSADSVIDAATIEAALNSGTSVFIWNINSLGDDPGTISIEADINKTAGGDAILNFNAAGDILVSDGVDISNTSGRMILYFVTHGGGVYAPNMGTIDLGPGEGQLLLAARDGGVIHSSGSIPYAIQFDQQVVPATTGSWDVSFSGGDQIGYDFTPGYVTFGTDAINLTGSQMGLSFVLDHDVRLYDDAVFVDNQSSIAWLFADDPDASMAGATIPNNIPELTSDGVLIAGWRSSTTAGVGGLLNTFPVLEVAQTMNPATQCGGITCVPVTPVVVPPLPQVVLDPEEQLSAPEVPVDLESGDQRFADALAELSSGWQTASSVFELIDSLKSLLTAVGRVKDVATAASLLNSHSVFTPHMVAEAKFDLAGTKALTGAVKLLAHNYVDQYFAEHPTSGFVNAGFVHSLINTGFNLATADIKGQLWDQSIAIAVEYAAVKSLNAGILSDTIAAAKFHVELQEIGFEGSEALTSDFASFTGTSGANLMSGYEAWNVDTGRKLRIISQLVRIRSTQLAGGSIDEEVRLLNEMIADFESTPISAFDRLANMLSPGQPGNKDYSDFSYQTSVELGLKI